MKHWILAAALIGAGQIASAENFTTAAEVKPIVVMTKANWVAVREFDGKDLLYFTHLEAWRCGMKQIRYFINEGKPRVWEVEPCYEDTNSPNAIKMEGHLPYTTLALGEVQSVTVEVTFDDDTIERETFARKAIMTP